MKAISSALQDHLNSGATTLCWCWRLTRVDGLRLGFTDHDRDLSFDDTLFKATSGFTASEIKDSVGLSVDNLDVSAVLSTETLSEVDLSDGLFDDARVEIWRVNWADTTQRVLMRSGSLGEVRRSQTAFVAEVRGLAHYLNQEKGRTFQFTCDADLGDARCGADLLNASNRGTGVVTQVLASHRLIVSGLNAFTHDWFSGGLVTWTSGESTGRRIEVKRHALSGGSAVIELWHPMARGVMAGDAFVVTAGCDKTFATCRAKFSNGANFRGFPHIPGNRLVTAVPSSGDPANNGASLVS